jgi:hypothetical protein
MLWKWMEKQLLGQPRRRAVHTCLGINLPNLGYDSRRLHTSRILFNRQDTNNSIGLIVLVT